MNEKGTKRREWVKTAAIIFLSVLLVLTFFSNTIMNYSLPEVAAQYVQSGTITARIRGSGVVESGDPYNVMVTETRKVSSVAVKAGDTVQKGDVLVYLEDTESDELKAAQDALETAQDNVRTAQDAYYAAMLSADINMDVIQAAGESSVSGYLQRIVNAHAAVEQAQKEVDEWTQKVNAFKTQIAITPENDADVSAETKALNDAKTAKENADFALTEVQNQLKEVDARLDASVSSGDASNIDELTARRNELQLAVISAQTVADNAQLAFDRAQAALDNKTATGNNAGEIANLQNQQAKAQAELDAATIRLTEKTGVLTEMNQALNLDTQYNAIVNAQEEVAKAQEEVAKQTEKSIGATVTAEVAGTVTSINVTAGESTNAAEPVAVLQPEGKGMTMSFSVTNDQAARLAVGDRAELVNAWRYEDVQVTLDSIRPDTTDPGQKKLLTFEVTGSIVAGQTLNVSVGQQSANYDTIVPNSAVREDNNGKFILVVETRSSPLGNRYYATRVDVEVLASDDTQSAVRGGLYGSEFVITTSTSPIEAGQLVRLAES